MTAEAGSKCTVLVFEDRDSEFKAIKDELIAELGTEFFSERVDLVQSSSPSDFGVRTLQDQDLMASECAAVIVDLKLANADTTSRFGEFNGCVVIQRVLEGLGEEGCQHVFVNTQYLDQLGQACPTAAEFVGKHMRSGRLRAYAKPQGAKDVAGRIRDLVLMPARMVISSEEDDAIKLASLTNEPVLLLGAAGTGKGMIAAEIHRRWYRNRFGTDDVHGEQFHAVNCALLRHLLQGTLFGHAPNAYSGASRKGQVGVALRACGYESYLGKGGVAKGSLENPVQIPRVPDSKAFTSTLFLDEIGELAPEFQPMLLRFLEEPFAGEPVGGRGEIRNIRPRILAATNSREWRAMARGEEAEVGEKGLRSDLFQRVDTIIIEVPELRARDVKGFLDANCTQPWEPAAREHLHKLVTDGAVKGNRRGLRTLVKRAELHVKYADRLGRPQLKRVTKELLQAVAVPAIAVPRPAKPFVAAGQQAPQPLDDAVSARHEAIRHLTRTLFGKEYGVELPSNFTWKGLHAEVLKKSKNEKSEAQRRCACVFMLVAAHNGPDGYYELDTIEDAWGSTSRNAVRNFFKDALREVAARRFGVDFKQHAYTATLANWRKLVKDGKAEKARRIVEKAIGAT